MQKFTNEERFRIMKYDNADSIILAIKKITIFLRKWHVLFKTFETKRFASNLRTTGSNCVMCSCENIFDCPKYFKKLSIYFNGKNLSEHHCVFCISKSILFCRCSKYL